MEPGHLCRRAARHLRPQREHRHLHLAFGADATDDATPPDVTEIRRNGAVLKIVPQNSNQPAGPYSFSEPGLTPGTTYTHMLCSEYGVNDDGSVGPAQFQIGPA